MKTMQSLEKIRSTVERIKNSDTQTFPSAASHGDTFRQGDLYLTYLSKMPENVQPRKFDAQLAPGNTQGSRHILSHYRVEMYSLVGGSALDGPILKVSDEVTVTHPEHGHVILPAGIYAVTYQLDHAEELRRVQD